LRDRVIRLAGSHDLRRMTQLMDDGARRLSQYFLTQTSVNARCRLQCVRGKPAHTALSDWGAVSSEGT
jgi:hypothetical protein